MADTITRRTFVKTGAAIAAGAALASSRAYGANERIRLGFIGVGNRGGQVIGATLPHSDAEIVALCDVYEPHLRKQAEKVGGSPSLHKDFREILQNKDIDAVVVATPDHWHAIHTVDACDAGKHVYVEKPLSLTIHEGRRMVEAARRNNRVVQVGTHRRSGKMYKEVADLVQSGEIGKVTVCRSYRITNMAPAGMGKSADAEPPADLDWDLWLGPAAFRPYRDTIAPYKFRWWKEYSSQIANWGVHFIDAIRWAIGEEAPSSIVSIGGIYAVADDRNIPDTMESVFETPSGCLIIFGQYEASGAPALKRGEMEIRGTLGTLYADDRGYEIIPEKGGQFEDPKPRMEPVNVKSQDGDLTQQHVRNFLDCVKSRQKPTADVEIGHRSTTFSHLGNIALATRSRIDWDAQAERITNNEAANVMLHYEYRAPWKLA
ncbi:MAG TPA: Gfo/Idh/MocA family oxidoreductase [Candidatus Bathyarchaeia archaeon]|nr:Gfo/Idh/MocA family oxidoreductase [Candidatus Bathyarchaeia archaeon]